MSSRARRAWASSALWPEAAILFAATATILLCVSAESIRTDSTLSPVPRPGDLPRSFLLPTPSLSDTFDAGTAHYPSLLGRPDLSTAPTTSATAGARAGGGTLSAGRSLLDHASTTLLAGRGPALDHPLSCLTRASLSMDCIRARVSPGASGISEGWQNGSAGLPAVPRADYGGAMAFDAFDGVVVYFGGNVSVGSHGVTWLFTGTSWQNETGLLPRAPPAETWPAMGYDEFTQVVLLYGGCSRTVCPDNYTWYYTVNSGWTNLTSSLSPASPALQGASMAYAADAVDGYTVLFGGCEDSQCLAPVNITFGFDGFGWIRVPTAASPPAGWAHGLAFDPALGELVLFGGCTRSTCSNGQTWTFYNFNWVNRTAAFDSDGSGPLGRGYLLLTWDELDGTLLMAGGVGDDRLFNDTWSLSCAGGVCGWRNWTSPGSTLPPTFGMSGPSDSNATLGTMLFGGELAAGGSTAVGGPYHSSDGTFFFEPALSVTVEVPGEQPARTNVSVRATPSGGAGAFPPFAQDYRATWQYGGTVVTGLSANLSFAAPGAYRVVVTVYDRFGVNATTWFAYAASGPTTGILGSTSAWVGIPLNLTAVPATGGNPPYSYSWLFGDGGYTVGASVNHSWSEAGSFPVTVTVIDRTGVTFQTGQTVIVGALYASISAAPFVLDEGQSVRFAVSVVGLSGSLRYSWDFADGSAPSFQAAPTHVFSTAGLFNVSVSVSRVGGPAVSASQTVLVNPRLTGTAAATPTTPTVGSPVAFSATSVGGTGPFTFWWSFGDGATGFGNALTHRYTEAGSFNATVWINDSAGMSDPEQVTVMVVAPPSAGGAGGSSPELIPYLALAILLVLAFAAGMFIRRRRRGSRRSEPDEPSTGEGYTGMER